MPSKNSSAISDPSVTRVLVSRSTQTEPTTSTAWQTIQPRSKSYQEASTGKNDIQTSSVLGKRKSTTTEFETMSKKMETFGKKVHPSLLLKSPCGQKSLRQEQKMKRSLSLVKKIQDNLSSTEETSTMPLASSSVVPLKLPIKEEDSKNSRPISPLTIGEPLHLCMNLSHVNSRKGFCLDCVYDICPRELMNCRFCFDALYRNIHIFSCNDVASDSE